jgi:hypothetical protein
VIKEGSCDQGVLVIKGGSCDQGGPVTRVSFHIH